jgi:hypothetical protein
MPPEKNIPRVGAGRDAREPVAERSMVNSRSEQPPSRPHPDAVTSLTHPTPLREGVREPLRELPRLPPLAAIEGLLTAAGTLPHLTARDTRALTYLVLLRLLGYGQLRRLAFGPGDPSILRHRVRVYEDAGWMTRWTATLPNGTRERYAVPTRDAIRTIVDRLDAVLAEEVPYAPLVRLMLPRSDRRPLRLTEETPAWFAHQRDVNQLVTSIVRSERKILWASAWDCPFPAIAENYTLPQPDYVLVEEVAGHLRIVFGEHDRGTEDVGRFVDRKLALYDELAENAADLKALFGVAEIVIHVSVIDARTRKPLRRLQALREEANATARPHLFSFTLGGWLHAYPAGRVWFTGAREPMHFSRHWQDHDNPVV